MTGSKFLDLDGLNHYHTEAVKKLDPYVVTVGTQVPDSENKISDTSLLTDIEAVLNETLIENDTVLLKEPDTPNEGILYQVESINSLLTLVAVGGSSKYKSGIDNPELQTVYDLGGIKAGTTVGGLSGKPISEILDGLLFPTIYPTYDYPSATFELKNINSEYEVGETNVLPKSLSNFSWTTNKGSIKIAEVKKLDRSGEFTLPPEISISIGGTAYTDYPTTVTNNTITYTAKFLYAEGPQPLDSKGLDYDSPLSEGSISKSVSIKGLYPIYYGFVTTNNLDYNQINTTNRAGLSSITTFTASNGKPTNNSRIWVACPYDTKNIVKVSFGASEFRTFTKQASNALLSSPNGLWKDVLYDVFLMDGELFNMNKFALSIILL